MSQIWEYNGVQYEFDLMDAGTAERFQKACTIIEKKGNSFNGNTKSLCEVLKYECEMIHEFFDIIFGDGTSDKLFGSSKYNLRVCLNAYSESPESIMVLANRQQMEISDLFMKVKQSYPQPNREQRRRNKKKKK